MARSKKARTAGAVKTKILTVGHSTRSIEDFIALVKAHGVTCVADVRTVPKSRHNPQFSKDLLAKSLINAGVSYVHMPALGGLRHAKADSKNLGWRNASFRGFADYMQTPQFEDGLEELIALASKETVAIMCAEAVPWRCHRSLIADALLARGFSVEDILSATSSQAHKLTPFAKVSGRTVTYPGSEAPGGVTTKQLAFHVVK